MMVPSKRLGIASHNEDWRNGNAIGFDPIIEQDRHLHPQPATHLTVASRVRPVSQAQCGGQGCGRCEPISRIPNARRQDIYVLANSKSCILWPVSRVWLRRRSFTAEMMCSNHIQVTDLGNGA